MKPLLNIFLALLLLSCSKLDEYRFIKVSDNYLNLTNQSGTVFVNISANCEWEIISKPNWITIVPTQGKGDTKLTLLVQANLQTLTREGSISVVFKGEKKQTNSNNDIYVKQSIPLIDDYIKSLDSIYKYTFESSGRMDAFGQKAIDYALDCLGEDFYPSERGYGWFLGWYQYLEHRNAASNNLQYVWDYYYEIIERSNRILTNINKLNIYDEQLDEKKYLEAQALFFRAHSYYMLVQLFAERYNFENEQNNHLGIPIKKVSKHDASQRETVENVYKYIRDDLQSAVEIFKNFQFNQPLANKITLNCVYAVYARVSLTTGDWEKASLYAKKAYEGKALEIDYTYGFDNFSTEWIWGALIPQTYSTYASFFSHIDPYFGGYATLGNQRIVSLSLYNFLSSTDVRKKLFINHNNKERVGVKFSGGGEIINDLLYIKAGEMYLIEAEAEARRLNDAAAQDALFALISKRDPAYVKSTLTGEALIDHILMHRRADLWGEGQRFLDIKRLNKGMDRRDLGHNPAQWNAASNFPAGDKNFVFLIPKQEIDANPNMVQNPL